MNQDNKIFYLFVLIVLLGSFLVFTMFVNYQQSLKLDLQNKLLLDIINQTNSEIVRLDTNITKICDLVSGCSYVKGGK